MAGNKGALFRSKP